MELLTKDSDILRMVKETLPLDDSYICWQIRKLDVGTLQQQTALINWLWNLVAVPSDAPYYDRTFSLENWLKHYHPEFERSKENMYELRLKWLDWLINEREKWGE